MRGGPIGPFTLLSPLLLMSSFLGRLSSGVLLILILGIAACGQNQDQTSDVDQSAIDYAIGDTLTVIGTLVDTKCFALDKRNITDDHILPEGDVPACGTACAMQGIPVAVLEGGNPSGTPWILVSYPSQIFADYIATTVRVLGQFGSEGIIVPIHVDTKTDEGWARIL
ncbi:MAG: hypothetical protein BMS9Abin05_1838 [Rhodothermia bacterium]|nr:MAG: hypothetical protein BMS9Abin05_1838 [Rhodothermia bacterium]